MNKSGIALAGTILVDKLNEISAYPNCGELTKILSIKNSLGGCVPNTGIDLKKLSPGLDVYAIGKVGRDEEGEFSLKTLKDNGLDVSGIVVDNGLKTSFTDVMSIVGGQRTFFTFPGSGADFGYEDIDFDNLNVKMLHLGYFLLLDKVDNGDGFKILKKASSLGIKTSIDLVTENSDRYKVILPCLPYVDNLIINEVEGGKLADIEPTDDNLVDIAKALIDLGVRERVIIHTPKMGVCYHNGKATILNSYHLPKDFIKGTTGAGDAFCAGALLAIYNDLSDEEILEYATYSSTMSLTSVDATSAIKTIEESKEFCKNFKRR